jgi:hypothetical protein
VLALFVTAVAWFSVKITVTGLIVRSESAIEVLEGALFDTYASVAVILFLWLIGWADLVIMAFASVRLVFLILTDWQGLADNFDVLKRARDEQ